MSDELHRHIRQELEKATFKIIIENEMVGTGFFISPDGYFLTACHCVRDMRLGGDTKFFLTLEFFNGGRLWDEVFFDEAKSNLNLDLAVIKSNYNSKACLPLGRITKDHIESEITALGYPAGDKEGRGLGFYKGTIPRFIEDNRQQFETSLAIQGAGQSGGPVYHYGTNRVVGLVQEKYNPNVMSSAGLALRFDSLFEQWHELKAMNDEAAETWDRQIRPFIKKDQPKGKCGWIIPKLCNRYEERNAFLEFFEKAVKPHLKHPHFYFIHGKKKEGHDSFIFRITEEHIKKYAEEQWGEEKMSVCLKSVDWPDRGDMEARKGRLRKDLIIDLGNRSGVGHEYTDCLFNDIKVLCSHNQFVIICYTIDVSEWTKQDENLLRWYIEEGVKFKLNGDIPCFLLFFNLKYPRSIFFPIRRFIIKQRIKKIAENTPDNSSYLLEIELKRIRLKDLEEWFKKYEQHIKQQNSEAASIFKRCKTAEAIEKELEKLIEFHNRE